MSTPAHTAGQGTDDWQLPWEGNCRCGQVRLRITAPGFEVVAGEPVIGGLHGDSHHYCCPHCKSWMFTRTEGMDEFVNIRPTMLDRHEWFVPFMETWTDEKLPWATTPAVHSFGKLPDLAAFPALIQAYAQEGARPAKA
jgi:hypothetical protein